MFSFTNNSNKSSGVTNQTSPTMTASGSSTTTTSLNGYNSPYLDPEKDLKLNDPSAPTIPIATNSINVPEQFDQLKQVSAPTIASRAETVPLNPSLTEMPDLTQVSTDTPSSSIDNTSINVLDLTSASATENNSSINVLDLQSPLSETSVNTSSSMSAPSMTPIVLETNLHDQTLPITQNGTQESVEEPIVKPEPLTTSDPVSSPQDNLLTLEPDPFPTENIVLPSVETLASKQGDYATNPLQDTSMDPEKDLGITAEILSSIKGEPVAKVNNAQDIREYLDLMVEKEASDLHFSVGYAPKMRIDSKLVDIGDPLSDEQVNSLINQTLDTNQKELLDVNRELDFSYNYEKARFRVNAYHEKGQLAGAFRLIPNKIRGIEELNLPQALYDFTALSQGLFLVTGPTGSGKSTTIAAMIQEINDHQPVHIITIEDPIEYVYPKSRALIDQREMGADTHDWNIALKSILRQDPDVVVIGEMRDFETIQLALTIAETGHLVFATLHTNSSPETIDRIIDVFPPHQQTQVRTQLASSLKGVLSQRLIPKIGGGREAVTELLIVNSAVQNLIREAKVYQIDNVLSTSFDLGMFTLEKSLVKKVREGKISVETAQEYAIRPKEILKLMKSS